MKAKQNGSTGKERIDDKTVIVKVFAQKMAEYATSNERLKCIKRLLLKYNNPDVKSNIKFDYDDWMKIWKSMFYALWYAEMGKGAEDMMHFIIENLIIHYESLELAQSNDGETPQKINDDQLGIIAGFETLAREWQGIDKWRVDKYLYMLRLLIGLAVNYEAQAYLTRNEESEIEIEHRNQIDLIVKKVKAKSIGLLDEIIEMYVEELIKCLSSIKLRWTMEEKCDLLMELVRPFIRLMGDNTTVNSTIRLLNCPFFSELKQNFFPMVSLVTRLEMVKRLKEEFQNAGSDPNVNRQHRNSCYHLADNYNSMMIALERKIPKLLSTSKTSAVTKRKRLAQKKKSKLLLKKQKRRKSDNVPMIIDD